MNTKQETEIVFEIEDYVKNESDTNYETDRKASEQASARKLDFLDTYLSQCTLNVYRDTVLCLYSTYGKKPFLDRCIQELAKSVVSPPSSDSIQFHNYYNDNPLCKFLIDQTEHYILNTVLLAIVLQNDHKLLRRFNENERKKTDKELTTSYELYRRKYERTLKDAHNDEDRNKAEAAFTKACENSRKKLEKKFKNTRDEHYKRMERQFKPAVVFLNYVNLLRSIQGQETYETYKSAKSTIDIYVKAHKKFMQAYHEVVQNFPSRISHTSKSHNIKERILQFQKFYHHTFSEKDFFFSQMCGLYPLNQEPNPWIFPSAGLFCCYILGSISQSNFLFKKCDRYKQNRLNGKDHNPGEEFKRIIKKYTEMIEEVYAILSEENFHIKPQNKVRLSCNKFLFSELLHERFFSSLNTELFESLAAGCDIDLLLNYDKNSQPTASEQNALLIYDLLSLLVNYNIDLNELQKHMKDTRTSDDDFSIQLQLVYRFLSVINDNFEDIVSSCLGSYGADPDEDDVFFLNEDLFQAENFWKKNESFLMRFYQKHIKAFEPKPVSKTIEIRASYDKKKQTLINQLLLHRCYDGHLLPSVTGGVEGKNPRFLYISPLFFPAFRSER